MAKITIIGAGSVEFTRSNPRGPVRVRGAARNARDRSPRHRRRASRIRAPGGRATHRAIERRVRRVGPHESRASAFDGADYLINEIQVGCYPATRTDFHVPGKHGLRQTIAYTIGIGGIMRGLRTIPVMIEMADEMVERCPDGFLLN